MKKKWIILVIGLMLLLMAAVGLTACGEGGTDDPPPPASVLPAEPDLTPTRTVTQTKLVTYAGPSVMEPSSKVSVSAAGESLFVYETRVNHSRSFSYAESAATAPVVLFDFEGKITVEVRVAGAGALQDVRVLPLAYGIQPNVSGGVVRFDLEYPDAYTLEYKSGGAGAHENAVHIFTNEIETNPITADNVPANTVYLAPGVYDAGAIPVQNGTTVYLAGGSYVFGQIRTEGLQNVTVRGRGILSGAAYGRTSAVESMLPIEIRGSEQIRIEDIAVFDPAGRAVTVYQSKNITLSNLKIITARADCEGIVLQSAQNVNVSGGFIRSWGDGIAVQNADRGETAHITVENVTFWTDYGGTCEVGYETAGAYIKNVTFRNLTVLHNFHKTVLAVHQADDADISDIVFQNITIEQASAVGENPYSSEDNAVIEIVIGYSVRSSTYTRSGVRDVIFTNITATALGEGAHVNLAGENAGATVSDILFNNVQLFSHTAEQESDLNLKKNEYADAPAFSQEGTLTGAKQKRAYNLSLADTAVQKSLRPTVQQQGVEVPSFAYTNAEESYMGGDVLPAGITVTATHGAGALLSAPYDDGSGIWAATGSTAANLTDGTAAAWRGKPWLGTADEFAALTFTVPNTFSAGTVRVYLPENNAYARTHKIRVLAQYAEGDRFLSLRIAEEYAVSPATGNYFDIRVSASEVHALQLRLFRTEGMFAAGTPEIKEIKFFPASLTAADAIASSLSEKGIHAASNAIDTNDYTHWEATEEGAVLIVDMQGYYHVEYIRLQLPPLRTWETREQVVELYAAGKDGMFYSYVQPTTYVFDPAGGNYAVIPLPEGGLNVTQLRLEFYSNNAAGGYGAQLAELYVFGSLLGW